MTMLISDVFPPKKGGSGRWFWEVYRRLPRNSYLIAAGQDERQASFDETHDLNLVREPLELSQWGVRSISGLRGYWRAIGRLRKLARGHGVRMVHAGRCLPEGVMALVLKYLLGAPYICYIHGEDVNTARDSREHTLMVRKVLGSAECLIANSRNTAQLLMDEWRLPASQVRVLHPGVDTSRFVPAPDCPETRFQLGWAERTVVLTVGRLQRRKGQDQMIRALRQVRAMIPDVLYSIVGDGEDRDYLAQLARENGVADAVEFRGEPDDAELIRCYQNCDLFALPNRQVGRDIEGFGMVLLEAQACGKPVLAGRSGGTAETMLPGETGCIVPCEDHRELATAVTQLLADPGRRAQMGKAARRWVESQFSWDALVERAQEIFSESEPVGGAAVGGANSNDGG